MNEKCGFTEGCLLNEQRIAQLEQRIETLTQSNILLSQQYQELVKAIKKMDVMYDAFCQAQTSKKLLQ